MIGAYKIRRIRDAFEVQHSTEPFGKAKVIAFGDFSQLPPVQGTHLLRDKSEPLKLFASINLLRTCEASKI